MINERKRKKDIISSSGLDDLIFISDPELLTLEQQKSLRSSLIIDSFRYHYDNNEKYRNFCRINNIGRDIENIDEIPVFPTSVFKGTKVHTVNSEEIENWFTSSGTTGVKSHIPRDRLSIERLLGSVGYGMKYVGKWFDHEVELVNLGPDRFNSQNVWFKYVMSLVELLYPTTFTAFDGDIDFQHTIKSLKRIKRERKIACLIGPPYFVYLLCRYVQEEHIDYSGEDKLFVITGGGWKKNTNQSLDRADFNDLIINTLRLDNRKQIRDTFNQVELNTCFFEDDYHIKHVPPWVYARALDPMTLKPVPDGEQGLMSYMDASSTSYPAFLITDDIGVVTEQDGKYPGVTVDIVRRITTRSQKGCALTMSQQLI